MSETIEDRAVAFLNSLALIENINDKHPLVTKKQVFTACGLNKADKEFNRIWRILTKPMNSAYLVYQGNKEWMYFH